MCYTAVMQFPGNFGQIKLIINQQLFYFFQFMGQIKLLHRSTLYFGEKICKVGIVEVQFFTDVIGKVYFYLLIIEMVHFSDDQIKINLSDYLTGKLNYNYTYLANLFSEVKGYTIEQFFLTHKIEKVKELLVYDDLNLTEIAWKLHYSSVAHLSNQFKKMTGITPTAFKNLKNRNPRAIDEI